MLEESFPSGNDAPIFDSNQVDDWNRREIIEDIEKIHETGGDIIEDIERIQEALIGLSNIETEDEFRKVFEEIC